MYKINSPTWNVKWWDAVLPEWITRLIEIWGLKRWSIFWFIECEDISLRYRPPPTPKNRQNFYHFWWTKFWLRNVNEKRVQIFRNQFLMRSWELSCYTVGGSYRFCLFVRWLRLYEYVGTRSCLTHVYLTGKLSSVLCLFFSLIKPWRFILKHVYQHQYFYFL